MQEDLPAFRAGYCERAAETLPDQVSIGWAWVRWSDGRTRLAPGGISDNETFVAAGRQDLDADKTHQLLQPWLTGEAWQLSAAQPANAHAQRRPA